VKFIAGGSGNVLLTTTSGIPPWTTLTSPFAGTDAIRFIVWHQGIWLLINEPGDVFYSYTGNDGTWIATTSLGYTPFSATATFGIFAICGRFGRFMTAGVDMVWTFHTTTFGFNEFSLSLALPFLEVP